MNKKVIIEKNNSIAYEYLINNFASSGIKFKLKKSYTFIFFEVEVDSNQCDSFLKFVAKSIILSHKFQLLTR